MAPVAGDVGPSVTGPNWKVCAVLSTALALQLPSYALPVPEIMTVLPVARLLRLLLVRVAVAVLLPAMRTIVMVSAVAPAAAMVTPVQGLQPAYVR